MKHNIDGPANVIDSNTNGIDSISGERVATSTPQKAESVFLSKNSSLRALIVLLVGLKNF
jgi:hypothetical protein